MAVSRISTSSVLQGFPKSRSLLAGNTAYDPAATWLIQKQTLTSNTTTVTFSSIPQNYKSLQIRILARNTRVAANARIIMQVNSDTGTNYASHELYGTGSAPVAAGSSTVASMDIAKSPGTSADTNVFGGTIIDILDYASTSKYKTIRGFWGFDSNGTIAGEVGLSSGLWQSTSAITSITFTSTSATSFVTNSIFSIYGMVG